jgi:CBS domain-containing protein
LLTSLYDQIEKEKSMSLAELAQKSLYTVEPSEKIAKAARLMCDHSVGALVITDASGSTPLGVLTDRDIVWMIAEGLDPREAEVGQFVHSRLQTVPVSAGLSEVTRKMREHGVRRLPIVDQESRLIGLVSLDDVLVLLGRELADAAGAITGELGQERRIGALRKGERPA